MKEMKTMTTLFPTTRMLEAALKNSRDHCRTTDQRASWTPRADVLEGEVEFRIVLDLPGVQIEDLEINLEKQTLTVKATKANPVPEGFELRRHERAGEVQFNRTFNLGEAIDGEKIAAELKHGVLQINLPKSEVTLPRRIDVK